MTSSSSSKLYNTQDYILGFAKLIFVLLDYLYLVMHAVVAEF